MKNEIKLTEFCKEVFGKSTRRYRQLADDGMVPAVSKNKIDLVAASKALIEYYRKLSESQGSATLQDERIRLTRINADMKELELKKQYEEVIYASDVTLNRATIYQKIRTKLLAMPVKLSPLIVGQKKLSKVRDKIETFIREALTELADIDIKRKGIKKTVSKKSNRSGRGSLGDVQAAAKTDNKPVQRKRKSVKS